MSLSYQQLTVRGVDNELEVCEPTPSSKLSQDSGICLKDTSENRKKEKYISYPAQNLKLQNSKCDRILSPMSCSTLVGYVQSLILKGLNCFLQQHEPLSYSRRAQSGILLNLHTVC